MSDVKLFRKTLSDDLKQLMARADRYEIAALLPENSNNFEKLEDAASFYRKEASKVRDALLVSAYAPSDTGAADTGVEA